MSIAAPPPPEPPDKGGTAPFEPPPPPPPIAVTPKPTELAPELPTCVVPLAPPAPTVNEYVVPGVSVDVPVKYPPAPPPPALPPAAPPAIIKYEAVYGTDDVPALDQALYVALYTSIWPVVVL
jgi:hypothetical protein